MILAEEILLLALDDESGKVSGFSAPNLNYALSGALIMELALMKKISLQTTNKKKEIIIVEEESGVENPILNFAFEKIKEFEKTRKLDKMIHVLNKNYSYFREEIFNSLVNQGILKRVEKIRLKIFKSVRHPMINPEIKEELLLNIQGIIIEGLDPSDRLACVLSLIGATEMIGTVFTKEYRKMARKKIKEITQSSIIGKEIKKIIESMQAVMIAVIIASTTAATSAAR